MHLNLRARVRDALTQYAPRHVIPARLHLEERGRALLMLAVVWVMIGLAVMFRPDPDIAHRLPIEYAPHWIRAAIWWIPAGIAVVTAWWPVGKDKWGYVALVIPVAFRGISYTIAFALGVLTGNAYGWSGYLLETIVWAFVMGLVVHLAGRVNAHHPEWEGTR